MDHSSMFAKMLMNVLSVQRLVCIHLKLLFRTTITFFKLCGANTACTNNVGGFECQCMSGKSCEIITYLFIIIKFRIHSHSANWSCRMHWYRWMYTWNRSLWRKWFSNDLYKYTRYTWNASIIDCRLKFDRLRWLWMCRWWSCSCKW